MKKYTDKYIVGVSGGSDSMVLLDMLNQAGVNIIVCHINYHQRTSANRDQKIVEDYCLDNNLLLHVYDYKNDEKGNFQGLARNFRYKCFKDLIKQYHAKGVMVAHQLEDHIETYLIQQNRGQIPNYYGLKEENIVNDILIIRPLLKYSKREIYSYTVNKKIKYGEDESNQSTKYLRNKIRIEQVNNLNKKEVSKLLAEINKENENLANRLKKANEIITQNSIKHDIFIKYQDYQMLMRIFLKDELYYKSPEYVSELYRQISLPNAFIKLEKYYVINDGENIMIKDINTDYEYVITSIELLKTPYFKIVDKAEKIFSATVSESDFPITIRSPKSHDYIEMRFGKKKLNRWFIDRKINRYDRLIWPVVLNCDGKVILVPEIGCDLFHYSNNPNLFVIK